MSRSVFCLLTVVFLQAAAGLRVPVAPTHAVQTRAASPFMALPKIEDAKSLSNEELTAEIINAKKELFELRKNVKTRQQVKPHLFAHTKHRIAQLSYLLGQREEQEA